MEKHLVLIDGHHLMYRAFWAIPRTLTTSKKELVNTVFGMASMLITILKQEQPDAMVLCFDEGEDTFRHKEHGAYKEGRAETPDEFYAQIPRVMELIDAFGFPRVSNPGFEADDLLGTYAKAGEAAGMRVTIVTGDRDALQLASGKTRIAIPHKGYQAVEYLGPKEVETTFGIRPDQVADYKGLTGDSSDNLAGVQGIGPKTAAKLLQQYPTLEALYAHLDALAPAVREKLEKDKETAFFCRRLAVLVCDLPLAIPLAGLALRGLSADRTRAFLGAMEFAMLSRRFDEFLKGPVGRRMFEASAASPPVAAKNDAASQLPLFS